MPYRLPTPCSQPGCGALSLTRYCPAHTRERKQVIDQARPNAAARGYGARWQRLRRMFLRGHPFCACGAVATDADHIVPRRRGGTDDEDNLQALCHTCHSRKTATEDGRWGGC